MGQGMVHVFALLSVVAAAGILYWLFWAGAARDRLLTVALGAITAGIFGNLYDRLGMPRLIWPDWHPRAGQPVYAVRDWLHFKIEGVIDWPVFNIADSLLVCGAALLFWQALRQSSAEKRGQ
jgi:signal peptidase II